MIRLQERHALSLLQSYCLREQVPTHSCQCPATSGLQRHRQGPFMPLAHADGGRQRARNTISSYAPKWPLARKETASAESHGRHQACCHPGNAGGLCQGLQLGLTSPESCRIMRSWSSVQPRATIGAPSQANAPSGRPAAVNVLTYEGDRTCTGDVEGEGENDNEAWVAKNGI